MKKIYKYTSFEENEINIEQGYTEKQLNNVCDINQYQVNLEDIFDLVCYFFSKRKKCEICKSQLKCIKECTYVGLRHPAGTTGGSYEKTYRVKFKTYCPSCKTIID